MEKSKFQLSADQQRVFESYQNFIKNPSKHIFILRGYAGTGKTTLIKQFIAYTEQEALPCHLMAPTGRAAKILRDKTGKGETIHKGIYVLNELKEKKIEVNSKEDDVQFIFYFPIRGDRNEKNIGASQDNFVALVDEASMVSAKPTQIVNYSFGTNNLLADLLTFMQLKTTDRKLVLVGDPAQLPPVNENKSEALNSEYFEELGYGVVVEELVQVHRQAEGSPILENAMRIRRQLENETFNQFYIEEEPPGIIELEREDLVASYCNSNPLLAFGGPVIICYSNKQTATYNNQIREMFFDHCDLPQVGDLMMVVQNNYHKKCSPRYNGDFAKVTKVFERDRVEKHPVPVYVEKNGERIKEIITLTFRPIELQFEDGEIETRLYIENLLESEAPSLTILEFKALYILFCMLNPKLKPNTENFKEALLSNHYFNALRLKYAYAITAHKSQGGEWDQAYVEFSLGTSSHSLALRWAYTAMTRCKEQLIAIELPKNRGFVKFTIGDINKVKKIPKQPTFIQEVRQSPYHESGSMPCKWDKYWEVEEKLKGTVYQIERIKSNPWMEQYYINDGETTYRFDTTHNKAGNFKPFIHAKSGEKELEILNVLNKSFSKQHEEVAYYSEEEVFMRLYEEVKLYCEELNIAIIEIKDYSSSYYLMYYLCTDSSAYIQFYYDKNYKLTKAIPASLLGKEDKKLVQLVTKMQSLCQ